MYLILPGAVPAVLPLRPIHRIRPCESNDPDRLGNHRRLLHGAGRHRVVVVAKDVDFDGLLPGRPRRWMVCGGRLDLRIRHFLTYNLPGTVKYGCFHN